MMADSLRAEEDEKILLVFRDKVLFRKMDVLLRVSLHEGGGSKALGPASFSGLVRLFVAGAIRCFLSIRASMEEIFLRLITRTGSPAQVPSREPSLFA